MFQGMRRPHVDLPEFSRCCCCLPLRYGLLVWGYVKLIGLSFSEYFLIDQLSDVVGTPPEVSFVPVWIVIICVITIDILSTIIFIVGGHMKHRLLYKIYYYYSVAFLISFILVWIAILINEITESYYHGYPKVHFIVMYLVFNIFAASPIVVVQGYVTLLVRSELRKLSDSNVQFVNDVAMFIATDSETAP